MKNRKAKQVRFHDAIQIGGTVLTSLDQDKHGKSLSADGMELWPMGVHFTFTGPQPSSRPVEMFVPFTNTPYIELLPEKEIK